MGTLPSSKSCKLRAVLVPLASHWAASMGHVDMTLVLLLATKIAKEAMQYCGYGQIHQYAYMSVFVNPVSIILFVSPGIRYR